MALILITNDDGYASKGLRTLVEVAKEFGEVVVVAPDGPRSASSHAITMNTPLRLHHYHTDDDGTRYFRTNGTPCDCVKLGLRVVLKDRPADLVLSGINHGSNSSVSLIYSGTMAAAIEAAFDNIPAVGLSVQDYSPNADFTASIHYGRQIVEKVLEKGLPPYICLNVNVPKAPLEAIKGIRITRQCHATWHEDLQERTDPYGRNYYWLTGWLERLEEDESTCEGALQRNYVSVQPVQFDLTAHQYISSLKYLEL